MVVPLIERQHSSCLTAWLMECLLLVLCRHHRNHLPVVGISLQPEIDVSLLPYPGPLYNYHGPIDPVCRSIRSYSPPPCSMSSCVVAVSFEDRLFCDCGVDGGYPLPLSPSHMNGPVAIAFRLYL